jgi:hypothetical protein
VRRACRVEGSWFPLFAAGDLSAIMHFSVTMLHFDGVMDVVLRWYEVVGKPTCTGMDIGYRDAFKADSSVRVLMLLPVLFSWLQSSSCTDLYFMGSRQLYFNQVLGWSIRSPVRIPWPTMEAYGPSLPQNQLMGCLRRNSHWRRFLAKQIYIMGLLRWLGASTLETGGRCLELIKTQHDSMAKVD